MIDSNRIYDRKKKELERSRIRYDYLFEHYETLVNYGFANGDEYDYEKCNNDIDAAINEINNIEHVRQVRELYIITNMKSTRGAEVHYREFYNKVLFPIIHEAKELIDDLTLEITDVMQKILEDLGNGIKFPKLIRLSVRGTKEGEIIDNTNHIIISKNRMNQRYENIDDVIVDYSIASEREAEVLRTETSKMQPIEIVTRVRDLLLTIAESRKTTEKELRKIAQMTTEAIYRLEEEYKED